MLAPVCKPEISISSRPGQATDAHSMPRLLACQARPWSFEGPYTFAGGKPGSLPHREAIDERLLRLLSESDDPGFKVLIVLFESSIQSARHMF